MAKSGLGLHSMGSYVHAGDTDTKQRAVSSMARPSKGGFDTVTMMSEGRMKGMGSGGSEHWVEWIKISQGGVQEYV